jgi:hypothetical protein
MSPTKMTAAQILAIPVTAPERFFTSPDTVSAEKRALAKIWHPDLNGDSEESKKVFAHINAIADKAEEKVAAGSWKAAGVLEFRAFDGSRKRLRFLKQRDFELGTMVYGRGAVSFVLKSDFADLFHTAKKRISGLTYASPKMEQEISRYMPKIKADFETDDQRFVMVIEKTPDLFLLEDVRVAAGGRIDPKHVAWILNSVYNICSYLQFAGVSHNAIAADTIFISPKFHSSVLAGGWWYAAETGRHLNALPSLTHRLAPPAAIREKKADPSIDTTMVKVLGRYLLGDVSGMNLKAIGVPAPMIEFLRKPAGQRAYQEYAAWGAALKASFGDRRFVEMDITESDIYKD